jgi:hypothetical protein
MTDFDRIFASAPLNKTAGAVTSKGQGYVSEFKPTRQFWEAQPLIHPTPPIGDSPVDLTGVEFGRLQVIGILKAEEFSGGHAKWVVRCRCGIYEARRAKAIRAASPDAMCQFCGWNKHLRWLGSQQRSVEDFVAESCDPKESKF